MASENNDIGEIVKKCKILLLDIEGTTTSISFVKEQLFPYAEANVKGFLESQWDTDDVKEVVAALRKLAIEDEEQKVEGAVAIPPEDAGKEEQIESLVKSVKWQMSADRKAGPLKQLQGLIWKQGYDNGDIKGHVYEDVAPALSLWNSTEGQKVYIYSSGSVQAQKLLFSCSVAGDLLPQIEGHFDTAVGAKQEAASYAAIVESIGCNPDEILFLTDVVKEAEAARSSGLHVALVVREGNSPLPADAASSYPVLQSFDKLTVTNKRKPDPQEQEIRAKIPKTDIEAKEKTAEMEVSETAPEPVGETKVPPEAISTSEIITTDTNTGSEPEKMEVEEDAPITKETTTTEKKANVTEESGDTAVRIETIVEEVHAINEAGDAPVCNLEPVILEESVEKTDKNETDMEPESAENEKIAEIVIEPKEQTQEKITEDIPPVAEETTSTVVIQEVTNEKDIVSEGIELVDDLEPVVVEPPAVEMEDLSNVGDVLDKECDEIMLKVHDVTNLDNIPVKPLLNLIAEEDIEVECGENTNDIMDSILDSELELGEKLCEDIDININNVQEVTETKSEAEVKTKTEVTVETDKIPEVVKEASALTEATSSDVQECPVDVLPKPGSVTDIENNKLKEVTTDVPLDIKVTESEDNKMDSEESSAIVVKTQSESKESEISADSAKPAETDELERNTIVSAEIESKETIEEQLNKMESEDAETANVQTEINDRNSLQTDTEKKSAESITEAVENKMETEDSKPLQSEAKVNITEPEVANDNKVNEDDNVTPHEAEADTESKHTTTKDTVIEPEAIEKINGNVNGDTEVNQNGDSNKEEELSARLSVENGDNNKEMNGANGNGETSEAEKEQDENKETEITDIKVKTVATDEPRTDPIEQPVEA